MNSPEKDPQRKPYRSPVIQVYGDIRKLTQSVGNNGMNDKGGSSATMTSL